MWWTSTSYIDFSTLSGSMPWLIVRLPCGSRSTQSTRWPDSAKATARLRVVVVFATPPFWLAKLDDLGALGSSPAGARRPAAPDGGPARSVALMRVLVARAPGAGLTGGARAVPCGRASARGACSAGARRCGRLGLGRRRGLVGAASPRARGPVTATGSGRLLGRGPFGAARAPRRRPVGRTRVAAQPVVLGLVTFGTAVIGSVDSAAKKSHCSRLFAHARAFPPHETRPRGLYAARRYLPELLDKRLVIVTGKGGVGKSTVALALGLAAAAGGKRTIVCEVSAQERMSRVFHRARSASTRPRCATTSGRSRSTRTRRCGSTSCCSSRSSRCATCCSAPGSSPTSPRPRPGLRELVTIGKIWELAQLGPQASGRGASTTSWSSTRRRPATGSASCRRRGRSRTSPGSARSAGRRRRSTRSSSTTKTGVAIVALPEEMPVNETVGARARLPRSSALAARSRVHERALPASASSKSRGERLDARVGARRPTAPCGPRAGRAQPRAAEPRAQREQLAPARGARPERRSATLPFVFEPELGVEEIRELAGAEELTDGRGRASSSRASRSASARARAASERRPARRRSRSGWRPAA